MTDQKPQQPSDKRTVAQKIKDLENAVMQLFHVNDQLTRDLMNTKDAVKLLHKKVNAYQKASTGGEPLTDEVIDRIMIEDNVVELTQKIQNMVAQGFLEKEEQVSSINSFLVVRELDDSGNIRNPRIQFALSQLDKQFQEKFVGLKAGDTIKLKEGPIKIELLESYKIKEPTAPTPKAETPTDTATESVTVPTSENTPQATSSN